jgi:hypothetical protein
MNNRGLRIRAGWVLGINRNEPVRDLADPSLSIVETGEMLGEDLEETEPNTLNTTIQDSSDIVLRQL